MSPPRIYQSTPLTANQALTLDAAASHHLARVLRAAVDDAITLFNGDGNEYPAKITGIDKKSVHITIQSCVSRDVESPIDIYLAQGIARGEKMDFIIQKAVELGVSKIFPLITERCNVRLNQEREEKRLQHWQSIVISACEQSGRNRIPEIHAPQSLEAWLPQVIADLKFVLSPHVANQPAKNTLSQPKTIALLIGPEGGLSDPEVALASQHAFIPQCLGPRVLRTETATLATITAIQCQYGDFS